MSPWSELFQGAIEEHKVTQPLSRVFDPWLPDSDDASAGGLITSDGSLVKAIGEGLVGIISRFSIRLW